VNYLRRYARQVIAFEAHAGLANYVAPQVRAGSSSLVRCRDAAGTVSCALR